MSDDGRLDRLAEAVSKIRGGRRLDADRAQLIAGGVLAVLGLVAIVIGWYGTAHTAYGFEQMPYLVSGGLLGLAFVFLGGFVYFAYWVTRLVRESREQSQRTADLLEQLVLGSSNGSGDRASVPGARGSFVATRSGNLFHLPDCQVVAGRPGLRRVAASTRGLKPCTICNPLGAA
jgi:hypothetical protein